MFRRDSDATHIQHGPLTPWGFCGANYAEDPHDCKSTGSYVFMVAGSPILWKSKKQMSVSLSTMEAEYYTLGITCQEATWLKQIGQELLMSLNKPIHIYWTTPAPLHYLTILSFTIDRSTLKFAGISSENSFAQKLSALCISPELRMEQISSQKLSVVPNMTAASNCWEWSR